MFDDEHLLPLGKQTPQVPDGSWQLVIRQGHPKV